MKVSVSYLYSTPLCFVIVDYMLTSLRPGRESADSNLGGYEIYESLL
jgi:hypothetical protein